MNQETKVNLYKLIDAVEDSSILNAVMENVIFYTNEKDILDELSDKQLIELNDAIEQADTKDVLTFEDFKIEVDKWKSK